MRTFEGDSGLGVSTETIVGNGGLDGDPTWPQDIYSGSKTCSPIKDD